MKVKTFVCNMLHENCYIIYDETSHEAAVIDPGMYWDEEKRRFDDFIRENGLKIKYMLCTHLHFDHIFGCNFIEDTYGVKLSASLLDSAWVNNFAQAAGRFGILVNDTPRPVAYPLHEGDTLSLGDEELRCLATPGHSEGGMCFYAPDSALLFSGDTLFQGSIGRTDFEGGSYGQLIRSIQTQLLTLPHNTIVHPGHGDRTTIGDEAQYNPYI